MYATQKFNLLQYNLEVSAFNVNKQLLQLGNNLLFFQN